LIEQQSVSIVPPPVHRTAIKPASIKSAALQVNASRNWDSTVAAGEFALTHKRRLQLAPTSTELSRHD